MTFDHKVLRDTFSSGHSVSSDVLYPLLKNGQLVIIAFIDFSKSTLKTVLIQTQMLVATMCISPNRAKHLNCWMFS